MRQGESLTDAEEALLHHLATLKASVAEGVEAAPNLPALRTVLRDLFEKIELIRWPRFGFGPGRDSSSLSEN
jgi:hypothetical protein